MQRAISTQKERVVSRGRAFLPAEAQSSCEGERSLGLAPFSITIHPGEILSYSSKQDLHEPEPK